MFPIITSSSGFSHVSQIAIMSRLFSMTNSINSVFLLRIDWVFMAQNLAFGLHSTVAVADPAATTDTLFVAAVAATVVLIDRAGADVVAAVSATVSP